MGHNTMPAMPEKQAVKTPRSAAVTSACFIILGIVFAVVAICITDYDTLRAGMMLPMIISVILVASFGIECFAILKDDRKLLGSGALITFVALALRLTRTAIFYSFESGWNIFYFAITAAGCIGFLIMGLAYSKTGTDSLSAAVKATIILLLLINLLGEFPWCFSFWNYFMSAREFFAAMLTGGFSSASCILPNIGLIIYILSEKKAAVSAPARGLSRNELMELRVRERERAAQSRQK